MEVQELGHLVLYVRDLERSRRFYSELLGFREVAALGEAAVIYSTGRTHHELLLIEVGAEAQALPAGRRVGMYHFGLKIGDSDDQLREALVQLQEAGVPLRGATDHGVTHSLYVEDPDGHELELYIDVQPEIWRDDPMAMVQPGRPLRL